jgi:small GTP-binding protein
MAFINSKNKEIQLKIVYYGPGRSGKTTNLLYIYNKFGTRINSEMVSVKTHGDRTLFFDFLPMDISLVGGYTIKIQLYTVPGQVKYNATRRMLLKGVDGIVFVADVIAIRHEKNVQSLMNLQENLAHHKIQLERIPYVFQYNKIDLKDQGILLTPLNVLNQDLNKNTKKPAFPASAIGGINVAATLKKIISMTVTSIKKDLQQEGLINPRTE